MSANQTNDLQEWTPPNVGSMWKHENGVIYTVLDVLNLDAAPERRAEFPVIIAYRGPDGKRWACTIHKWKDSYDRKRLVQILGPVDHAT